MKKYIIIGVSTVVVLFAVAVGVLATYAQGFIEKYRHDIMGLAIDVGDIDVSVLTYGITLKDVKIYPAHKEQERYLLASAEQLRVSLVPHAFLRKMIHIRKLTLVRPKVNYIRTSMGHTNWEALNMSWLKDDEQDKGSLGNWRLRVDKMVIDDGQIVWRDRVTGGRFELNDTSALLNNIVDEPDPAKLPTKIRVEGVVGTTGAKASARGRVNLMAEGINFKIKARLKNAPITYFAPMYAGQVPFKIEGGSVSVSSTAAAKESYLTSTHDATIVNLKVGGLQGKLINAFVLREGNKIDVTAQVNGDLSKGNLRVSSQIGRIMGGAILADARSSAPVETIGQGLKTVSEKTSGAFKKLFRRKK